MMHTVVFVVKNRSIWHNSQTISHVRSFVDTYFPNDTPVTVPGRAYVCVLYEDLGQHNILAAAIGYVKRNGGANVGVLERCAVAIEHRNKGYNRHVVNTLCKALYRQASVKRIVTYVAANNCASLNSLFKCGFRGYNAPVKGPDGYRFVHLRMDQCPKIEVSDESVTVVRI